MPSLIDLTLEGRKVGQYGPWPRVAVDASVWTFAASELAHGRWSLLGLWGEPATVHMAIMDGQTAEIAVVSLDCPDRIFPSVGKHHPPALRLERTINDLFGLFRRRLARCPPLARSQPLGRALPVGRSHRRIAEGGALPFPRRGRRRPAPDCGRPGACGHHRARTFPLYRQRRDRGPAGTAAWIRP